MDPDEFPILSQYIGEKAKSIRCLLTSINKQVFVRFRCGVLEHIDKLIGLSWKHLGPDSADHEFVCWILKDDLVMHVSHVCSMEAGVREEILCDENDREIKVMRPFCEKRSECRAFVGSFHLIVDDYPFRFRSVKAWIRFQIIGSRWHSRDEFDEVGMLKFNCVIHLLSH